MTEPSIVIDQIDYPLMTVAKGAFLMGTISGTNNAKSEEEEPQRKVTLPSYLMGQYPITNIQYHQFVDDTNCQTPAYVDDSRFNQPHFPVTGISWLETENFLNWLNQLTKGTYRLPTEAEWEKAARGDTGQQYPWAELVDDAIISEWDPSKGNFGNTKLKRLTAVNQYPSGISPYGCYNMAGNCYEWCWDWFHPQTYKYAPSHAPRGARDGNRKVIRGGSWNSNGKFSGRCANRAAQRPHCRLNYISFRIASDPV